MNALLNPSNINAAAALVLTWVGHAVLYGTVLALLTAVALKLVQKRIGHALHAALWLIVLIKFVVPVGPATPWSLATATGWVTQFWHAPAAAQVATAERAADEPVIILVNDKKRSAAPAAAAPAVPWQTWLAAAYVAGVLIVAGLRIGGYRAFVARCRKLPHADDVTKAVVADVCSRLGVRNIPDVRLSEDAPAPYVLGAWRPMLILSRRHLVRPAELEAVLLHEIAHLRRGDLLARYLQWMAGTVLFFWPVVAWVNRRIDLARESACDEWALRHGRLSAGEYARCILRALHPVRPSVRFYRPAAMAANLSTIERRIDMILSSNEDRRSPRLWRVSVFALLVAWGAFALGGRAVAEVADDAKDGNTAKSQSQTWTSEDGQSITLDVSADGEGEHMVIIELTGDVAFGDNAHFGHGDAQQIFLHKADGAEAMHHNIMLPDEDTLAQFAADFPAADVDGDGNVSRTERGAYLTALAMSAPDIVLDKYPYFDFDNSGTLEASEAAAAFGGTGMVFIAHGAPAQVSTDVLVETIDDADTGEASQQFVVKAHAVASDDADATDGNFAIKSKNITVDVMPPSEWLLDNVLTDLTVDDVAAYIEQVQNNTLHEHLMLQRHGNAAFGTDAGGTWVQDIDGDSMVEELIETEDGTVIRRTITQETDDGTHTQTVVVEQKVEEN